MANDLQITLGTTPQGPVMYLSGRLNIESSPDLRHHLLSALLRQSPPEAVVIDFAGISYMDTSGIATLIEGLKIARTNGVAMRLQGLQGRLLHLFQATSIGTLFDSTGSTSDSPAVKVPSS